MYAVVTAITNRSIPKGTPFVLMGCYRYNGDAMTYCWEQTNNDISTQPQLQQLRLGTNQSVNNK
jgi:hypothetical protein